MALLVCYTKPEPITKPIAGGVIAIKKRYKGMGWVIVGAILWRFQLLGIITSQSLFIDFSTAYNVGQTIGSWLGGIIGAILIAIGLLKLSRSDAG